MLLVSAGGNGAGMRMHGVPQGWSLISVFSINICCDMQSKKQTKHINIYVANEHWSSYLQKYISIKQAIDFHWFTCQLKHQITLLSHYEKVFDGDS